MDQKRLIVDSIRIKNILKLLSEHYDGTTFIASFDKRFDKWVIHCSDYFIYSNPEYREVLSIFKETYPNLNFFSVVIHKITADVLRNKKESEIIVEA